MTIMIVEDNEQMRHTIRRIAAMKNDDVIECSNGAEAVSAFALHHPDWVLMDVNMPVLDGIAATRQIIEHDASARVVMVTDNDSESFRAAATVAGASGYVSKENLFELRTLMRM